MAKGNNIDYGDFIINTSIDGSITHTSEGFVYEKNGDLVKLKDIYGNKSDKWFNLKGFKKVKAPMETGGLMAKGGSLDLLNKVKESNEISEKEINLIRNRMNNNRADAETKELVQWIWDNNPELTEDQNKKGLDFLIKQWKTPTGKAKDSSPFGYREEVVLDKFSHIELSGFHDISKYGGREFYIPLYTVVGGYDTGTFQYYYDGKVNIVGAKGGEMGKRINNKASGICWIMTGHSI